MKISLFSRNKGNQLSFEELLAPHTENLYRVAYRFTNSQHDAEDLVQELLLKLYPRHQELLKVENLKPWLTRVLYNLFVDAFRRQNRSPVDHGHDHDELIQQQPNSDPGPLQALDQQDLQQQIIQALEQMSEEQRVLLVLHDVESYTLNELTTILDAPLGTLKSRLHRSREKLKKLLEQGTFSRRRAC